MSEVREPVPEPGPDWLAAVAEVQRQTAEAHMHFQDVLADAHRSFLRMAENTFAAFAGVPVAPLEEPPSLPAAPPLPLPPVNLPPSVNLPETPIRPTPPPVAAVPLPPPGPEPAAALDLGLLLDVVADKTGYPVDMLDSTMDLEADLGIDSIKKVEIFAAVRQRVAGMPPADSPQMAQLFQLRTLDQIVRWAGNGHEAHNAGPRDPSGNGDPGPPPPEPETVRRLAVRPVHAPAHGVPMAGLTRASLIVVDGGSGLAPAVVDHLTTHGITAIAADHPEPDSRGVLLLGGMTTPSNPQRAAEIGRDAFRIARTVAAGMTARGGVFVTVQDTGGRFGLANPDPERAPLGGLAALTRTAALEWPRAAVKAIDCERGSRTPDAVAAAIVAELLTGGATLDVGLRADGTRWTVVETAAATPAGPSPITADSVLVATGGARGVTAAALLALAAAHRPRMLLLGRTVLADEPAALAAVPDEASLIKALAGLDGPATPVRLSARARAILAAREVRTTLAALEAAGSTVRYATVDVTDRVALGRELDRVRREWGPITALVHAAGVLADKRIADKTDESFDRVYTTKVAGWHALLAATSFDPVKLLCVFSSAAARFGNPGQCDYAMANETLNHLACAERARRPDCTVRSIGWGPWAGGMVTESLSVHFRQNGIPLIPLPAGANAFVNELTTPDNHVPILVDAAPGTELVVNTRTHGYLADHAPAQTPVLPLALAAEWLLSAAHTTTLYDLQVLSRIDLPDLATGHRFTIERDHRELRIISSPNRAHYRARLAPVAPPSARSWPPITGSPVDNVYDDPALFHGPRFHLLHRLDAVSEAGADAQVLGVRTVPWPARPYWTDPGAIDGALQAAVSWASHAAGVPTLPMGIASLHIHRGGPAPTPLRCLVRAQTASAGQSICDIRLLDADGEARIELFGVNLIRRPDMPTAQRAEKSATG